MSLYTDILQRYWGYSSFRPMQEDIIRSVCDGKDTLGLMPTGGGKSITFQVPAMAMEGICIVVTPLIALMKDQVANLRKRQIKAAAIYSGMTYGEIIVALDNCIFGNYKFLYVSPERLSTELFQLKLKEMNVCLLTIDEAHCISQWGYDFRPSYLRIAELRELIPDVPVLALTATATPEVVKDIQDKLDFVRENVFQTSFVRPNLSYRVIHVEEKRHNLVLLLNKLPGSAVVYAGNRKKTCEIAEFLEEEGFSASYYHAGLSNMEKDKRQRGWQKGDIRIMVCTNAFGMGIDKPDVRLVVHIDLPDSPEAYFQEAGRAGRDGLPAVAIALCGKRDFAVLKKRSTDRFPTREYIRQVYDTLGNFLQVAEGAGQDVIFDFNIAAFCTTFHLPVLPTYHALKLLEQSGYIELTDEQDNASRVMFTLLRDELYRLKNLNKQQDELIHILLRTYTGLFTDYTSINEEYICQKMNIEFHDIYALLVSLSKARVLNYIPRKKTPFIIYIQRRIDSKYIVIPRTVYEDRKKRYDERIAAIIDYAGGNRVCRTRMLLAYFGEKVKQDCGICDVCLKRKKESMPADVAALQEEIRQKLKDKPIFIAQLVEKLDVDKDFALPVIRKMLDQSLIFMKNGILSLYPEK